MRLTVIGRNPQEANIVLDSQYISNYHAEIIQLDNGDMFLVDKSTNGTYLNGSKLTPGKEVSIKRGDNIMFADMPLNWNLIDEIRVPKDVKQIKGIGSHYMNAISVQGPNVSRFHATVRQMSDGKWYICDHSKNGTILNGARLQKNRFVRLKKGDEIICGGVPVQNPIPGGSAPWKLIVGIVAAACVGVFSYILFNKDDSENADWTPTQIVDTYSNTVSWVYTTYHFEASCSGIDFDRFDIPKEFIINEDNELDEYSGKNPMQSQGTAFFIGDKGHLVTNRHVARPWEAVLGKTSDNKSVAIEEAEIIFREALTRHLRDNYPSFFLNNISHIAKLEVKGVVDNIIIIPNGNYPDFQNTITCHEVACASVEEDLALLQIRNSIIAHNISSVPLNKINPIDQVAGKKIYTIGFPHGLQIQNYKNVLEANYAEGSISRINDTYKFGFTAPSYPGASGSPVFDCKGKLVGVINEGIMNTQGYNYAIKAKYLYNLLKQANLIVE